MTAGADIEGGSVLRRFGPDAWVLSATLIWGVNFAVVKVALAEIPPAVFNSVRYLAVAIVLCFVVRFWGPPWRIQRRHLPYLVALALLGNTFNPLIFAYGAAATTAANAALILAMVPVWVAVIGSLFGQERVSPAGWLGAVLSVAGIALMVLGADRDAEFRFGGATLRGDLLVFGATVCWTAYTLLVRQALRHYSAIVVTHFCILVGSVPLIAIGLPEVAALDWGGVSLQAWVATVFSGVVTIGFAYQLWNHGIAHLGSARTSFYTNLVPGIALLAAWLGLGETLTAQQAAGVLIALAGVVLARRHTRALST